MVHEMESRVTSHTKHNSLRALLLCAGTCLAAMVVGCSEEKEHTAPAINPRDSVPMMVTYGVNTLISDSGVIKYRIVSEKWEVNTVRQPSRWIFEKGIFLEQFDKSLHVESYIQCDTAYYYDTEHLWELRGRVKIFTKNGLKFSSEELYWDERDHEVYSNRFSHLVTDERELQGSRFKSDENMTKYDVTSTKGSFVKGDIGESETDKKTDGNDSLHVSHGRQPAMPSRNRSPQTGQ